ncbi:MAG: MBL fold metallo-hydrolase [Proteobacteria bacterium]|nr:MBL fold metallo-hydrolase [Pseudomonadota bacterium]
MSVTATSSSEGAALRYPFASIPEPGKSLTVAPGVEWLRMRLPMAGLPHINVWALEDEDGWALVDTGMQTDDTAANWQAAFLGPLGSRPVRRVICTHMHPDHIGMSGWLTRRHDCRLWTTRLEYITCRMLVADTGRLAPTDGVRFYRAAGWDEAALEHYRARFGGFGKAVHALPDSYRRVRDGERLAIGPSEFEAVVGCGHSPEHLCLYSRALKVFISGDQVLPRISSNVSVFPTEPDADPLSDWLGSLAALKARVADDVLVLPSHNEPFYGLHERLDALIDGHERRLERMLEELRTPRRAIDLFSALFRRPVGLEMIGMATGESLAHLNCLIGRGLIVRDADAAGILWYRRQ